MTSHIARIYFKFLASILLISAGIIHSFPDIWKWWEVQIESIPVLHHLIGSIGIVVGIISLIILIFEIKNKKK